MTIKTLEELNLEFMSKEKIAEEPGPYEINEAMLMPEPAVSLNSLAQDEQAAAQPGKKKRSTLAIISGILFYLAILMVVFAVLTASKYTFFTVLTTSMQDEIPKGSLILIHRTDPQELKVGDNITFMRDWKTSVTHKIADIYEDYQSNGARGFRTKGVNNANHDREIVDEENIVGKVVFTLPAVGAAISYLGENIYIVFAILGLCVTLFLILRILINKSNIKQREQTINNRT